MAQPTLETVTMDAGSGGSTVLVETVGSDVAPVSMIAFSTGDGTINVVTDSGTESLPVDVTGSALTALQLLDDIVHTDDASTHATGTTKGAGIMAAATPTDGSVAANDIGMLAMSLSRRLHVDSQIIGQNADITIADGGNDISIDWAGTVPPIGAGTEAAALRCTIATNSTGVLSVDDNGNSLTVDWAGTAPPVGAGVEATALRVTVATDSTGVLSIDDNAGSLTVDNSGTFATQATLQANSGVDIGDVDVTSIISGTGATNLGKAQDTAVGPTDTGVALLVQRDDEQAAVTPVDGDYVVPRCDRFGNLKTTSLPDATSKIKYGVIDTATSGNNTLQAAAGVGIKIVVLSAFLVARGTVNARFESGADGTAMSGVMNLVVNSGFVLPFNPGGWFATADNALLNLELSAAINVDGSFSYVEV